MDSNPNILRPPFNSLYWLGADEISVRSLLRGRHSGSKGTPRLNSASSVLCRLRVDQVHLEHTSAEIRRGLCRFLGLFPSFKAGQWLSSSNLVEISIVGQTHTDTYILVETLASSALH
ncbi:hypothetical protein AOLI_G00195060 [Acnodon oligacanthus]